MNTQIEKEIAKETQTEATQQFLQADGFINQDRPDLLGAIVMFNTQRGASRRQIATIGASEGLDQLLAELGIDLNAGIPALPEHGASFNFAVRNSTSGFVDFMGRVIKEASNQGVQVGAIMHRTVDKEESSLDYLQRRRVALLLTDEDGTTLATPRLICEKAKPLTGVESDLELEVIAQASAIVEKIEHLYQWHRDHLTPEQIRPWIVSILEAVFAIKLQSRGNCYFVPAIFIDHMKALSAVLKGIGCQCRMFPQYRDEWTIQETTDAFMVNGVDEVASTLAKIEEFASKIDEGGSVRTSTIEKLGSELEQLEKLSEMYQRFLSADISELQGKIDEAVSKLQTLKIEKD